MVFTLIYGYMFFLGYIIAKIRKKSFDYYSNLDFDYYFILILILYLIFCFFYFIVRKLLHKKKNSIFIVFFKFDYFLTSLILLLLGILLSFEAIFKMNFMPFWIYGGVPKTSGYPDLGFRIFSISAGLDFVFRNVHSISRQEKYFLTHIFFLKLIILFLYAKSRSTFLWVIFIIGFYLINESINNKLVRKLLLVLPIIILFFFIGYRLILVANELNFDLAIEYTLATTATEFIDFSRFIENFDFNEYPDLGKRLLNNLVLAFLPDRVWNILGVDKFSSGVFNRGVIFHSILFGSENSASGVRISAYGEFYALKGFLSLFIGCVLFGIIIGFLSRQNNSLFAFLFALNIAFSQINGLIVIPYSTIVILIVSFVSSYSWQKALKELNIEI